MAEYAGLEIRIGGNTTKLNNALKASTKSAAELYRNIRQITRAMQFDPTNLKNVETRIRLTGDRMQSLQAKTQITKTAMDQLGDTMVKFKGDDKSIRAIAEETENLTIVAKQADERYNTLTGSLAEVYEAWNKLSRNTAVDYAKSELNIDKGVTRSLMDTSTSVDELREKIKELNSARRSGLLKGPIISNEQVENLIQLKNLNFHNMFKNGLELDDVVEKARDLGVAISDSAVESVRELQRAFKEAGDEKAIFDDALKFEQMGTDIQRLESEAEDLSQTMRELDDSMSDTSKGNVFQYFEREIRKVDAALDSVEKDLERTEAAMKLDPQNVQLATRYFNDLQQKVALSQEKEALLNKEMNLLKANGADEAAKSHEDLAKWIEESAESARTAKKELSDQQATVRNLEDSVKSAKQSLASLKKDTNLAEYSESVLKWRKYTDELNQALNDLETKERSAADALKYYNIAADNLSEAKRKAEETEAAIGELEKKAEQLMATMEAAWNAGEMIDPALNNELVETQQAIEELGTTSLKSAWDIDHLTDTLNDRKLLNNEAQKELEEQKDKVEKLSTAIAKLEERREVKLVIDPSENIAKEEAAVKELEGELDEARRTEERRQDTYDSAAAENNLAKEAKEFENISQRASEAGAEILKTQDAMEFKSSSILNASTIKSLGMTLSATVTPAIYGVGRSMIDASGDIDSAYRNMRKTVDGTEQQFESLRQHAMEFSSTHVTSADQILEIEALGGELGIATENLEAFAEAISNIDASSNLGTEEAAETLGHLANIMHLTADDYEGFSNALVRLGNNGASTESEIANIAERIGSMGSIVGMSASDVLAWASSIASTGQNAEAAGTAISKTMSFMETAVAAAGGSLDTSFEAVDAAVQEGGDQLTIFANLAGQTADEFAESWASDPESTFEELSSSMEGAEKSLQGIADVAHMSAADFAKAWESDPTSAMQAFIEGLNDVEASGGSADAVLQSLGITSVRQKQAIEGLMQTVGGLDDNLKMSEDAWNGITDKWGVAGDAANEAAKKAEGFSGQLQIMKNMAQNALAELGEGAAPILKMLAGMFGSLSDILSGLSTETKTFIVASGGIAALTGPILTMASSFITAGQNVSKWMEESVTGLSAVKAAYAEAGNAGVKALTGTNYQMAALSLTMKQFGATVLKSLAFAGVAFAIYAVGSALHDLNEKYKDHIDATSGLRKAIMGIGEESVVTAGSISETNEAVYEAISSSAEYEERLADLYSTISESNAQYSTYAGTLSYYGDTIRELADKENRTQEESAKLSAALSGINEACSTTYAIDEYGNIIDEQTGKIIEDTDAIYANIDARKAQALMEYYSDDYTKAVGELTEAQEKLTVATQEYEKLTSKSGKAEYFAKAKEEAGAYYNEKATQAAYELDVERASKAMNNYSKEVAGAEEAVGTLEYKIDSAQKELDEANKTLEEAAEAQEEYDERVQTVTDDVTGNMKRLSDAIDEAGEDDSSFNSIADGLEAIHVSADELDSVDMSSLVAGFDSANGSMEQIIATLENGGVHMDTWNAALEQAPGAAQNMSTLTAAAFNSMYQMAGGDINATMTLIAGLNTVQVGDKTFYIGDNGSVTDSEGKIYDLKTEMDQLPDEVQAELGVDNSDAKAKTKEVNKALDATNSKKANPKITAKDTATTTANAVNRRLNLLDGKTVTTYIRTVSKSTQATGGMNSRPVIPKHATGYIATGPTLTNQGWIGEDGIEAVANWATGGAVVPLTNKKYMLPIADAIAEGMSKRVGGSGTVNNYYVNDAIVNGDEEIQAVFMQLFSVLERKGAMNRG